MEKLILRNYYSSLTASAIGENQVTEDVSQNLSPRYSRNIFGQYSPTGFSPSFTNSGYVYSFCYGTKIPTGSITIWFGKNTAPVTFDDYAPVSDYAGFQLTAVQTSTNTIYDSNSKTYTNVRMYTITNPSDKELPVNEILIGSDRTAYLREVLNENSFIIGANESVKFELTIKYTIAEPLQ